MCEGADGKAQGQNWSSTEGGSALGPDWHEGLVLRGSEQVMVATGLGFVLKPGRSGWKFCTNQSFCV